MKTFRFFISLVSLIVLLAAAFSNGGIFIYNYFGFGVDDTDMDGFHRSGLKVHIDYKTGVQYLSDGRGGLVKREAK